MKTRSFKRFHKIKIYSGAEALAAALFSLAASGCCLWLLWGALYDGLPIYDELAAGGTIWDGYYKQGDLRLFYLLYLFVPFFFCLFLYVKHTLTKKTDWIDEHPERMVHGKKTKRFARMGCKKDTEHRRYISNMTVVGEQGKMAGLELAVAALLGAESVRALEIAASGFAPGRQDMWNTLAGLAIAVILIAACGLAVYLVVTKRKGSNCITWLLMFSQLFLPFQFLGYFHFYYQYESVDGLIQLFYSVKWKWFCIALFLIFLFCQLKNIWRKKSGVYLSSVMMLAAEGTMRTPEGVLNIDFFHTGEMAFPMQQLLSYGQLPYFDIDPIHGFCDYFYSLLNVVFFDGKYFSQNAAIQAAGLLMALFLAFVIGKNVRNRFVALLLVLFSVPYLVQSAGVRYLLFFAGFFILLGDGARKDGRKWIWWWVMLCILGISWNVSIGSSLAVAFLPEVLYRLIKEVIPRCKDFLHWEKEEKRRYLISYGILIVIGVCYIPLFLQILRFLSENAGTTLYVNGTTIFGEEFAPVKTFAFLLPYLCALVYALTGSRRGKSAFVSMFACLLVITNYACVRYDEGARLAVLAVFFMTLFAGMLLTEEGGKKEIRRITALLFFGMGIYLVRSYLPGLDQPMEAEKIAATETLEVMGEESEDPIVYVSGESVEMPALGTGFMRGSTLNSLKNIQTVFRAELDGEDYLDLTNKVSDYVIFDKESVLPFTSAYNISNDAMQEKAIALVKEKRPRLILAAPLIQFDLAPVSLRSMDFYTELIRMGYQPYVYGDAVYLLDGEAALTDALDGRESLGLAYHKEYLGMLPVIWGASAKANPEILGANRETLSKKAAIEATGDRSVQIAFDTQAEMKNIDFIKIVVSETSAANEELRMSFYSTVDSEEHDFVFSSYVNQEKKVIKSRQEEGEVTYLLPVGSSPFWQFSDSVSEGEIAFSLEGISADAVIEARLISVK